MGIAEIEIDIVFQMFCAFIAIAINAMLGVLQSSHKGHKWDVAIATIVIVIAIIVIIIVFINDASRFVVVFI